MAQIYGEQPGREVPVNSWLQSAASEMLLDEGEMPESHLNQPKTTAAIAGGLHVDGPCRF